MMRGWIRLAIVLAAFWLFGCAVVLLIEISQLPRGRECTSDKPPFGVFFRTTRITAVHVRYPPLGIVTFPATMSRKEIEDALHRNPMKYYESTNALVEWDVPVDKQDDYYSIALDGHRFISVAIFPSIAIFVAALVAGCGARWVVQGFKK